LKNWDYRNSGAYFITINTKNRYHYFGEVKNGKKNLSHIGIIADIMWYEIKNHSKNIDLGEYVIMPDHVHGILILKDRKDDIVKVVACNGSTADKERNKNQHMSSISPKPDSISTIIRSYKSAVTKHAHRLGFEFQWQSKFHDHIIRDEKAFENITTYIKNNPANWEKDNIPE